MCLAILVPKNKKLPKEHAEAGFSRNRDGAGFAFCQDGKVEIQKGFFEFDKFWDAFDTVQQNNDGPFLVHFRIATCGPANEFNCHPWAVDEKHAFIHNAFFEGLIVDHGNSAPVSHLIFQIAALSERGNVPQESRLFRELARSGPSGVARA